MALEQPQPKNRVIEMAVTPDKKMHAEIVDLPLKKLKLDSSNVRFHHFANKLTDAQIEEEIWKESDTRDLFREILNSRGLSEPPIVDSSFVVMEGNRRIVCLRKLADRTRHGEYPQIPENTWDTVTSYVLPKDTPQKDIAILLGRLHVSGKKEWKALNQAAHIYELFNKHGATQGDITNLMSMGKSTVGYMIKAFQLTTDYGKKYPEDTSWVYKFSYFYEMVKRKSLDAWLENNGNTEKFMEWLYNGKISRGMDVRKLPEVIKTQDAIQAIDSGGFDAALKVLSKSDPAIDNKFYAHVKDMVERLNDVPREELVEAGSDPVKLEALQKLRDTVDEVIRNVAAIKQR
jgi:hypothetical protein